MTKSSRFGMAGLQAHADGLTFEAEGASEDMAASTLDDILVAAVEKQGYVTSRQVAAACDVPIEKARHWLGWLVEEGRLQKVGQTKATRFMLPSREPGSAEG